MDAAPTFMNVDVVHQETAFIEEMRVQGLEDPRCQLVVRHPSTVGIGLGRRQGRMTQKGGPAPRRFRASAPTVVATSTILTWDGLSLAAVGTGE